MTRIIAGVARGRGLRVPKGGTRPTSNRVRESMFAMIDHQVRSWSGCHVLDLYAGSGALALEALSRGADRAVAVERNRGAATACRQNAIALELACTVVQKEVAKFLGAESSEPFDIVFLDPPYDLAPRPVEHDLLLLADRGWLASSALVVLERSRRGSDIRWPADFEAVRDRRFGDTRVVLACWRGDGTSRAAQAEPAAGVSGAAHHNSDPTTQQQVSHPRELPEERQETHHA